MPIAKSARPGVTYIIAAYDATDKVKAIADYICDGTADDVEIQAAIDAFDTAGGTIVLSEGTFRIASTLVIARSDISLRGWGGGSIGNPRFTLQSDVSILQVGDTVGGIRAGNIGISGIYFHANHHDMTTFVDFQRFNDVVVNGCWIWGSDGTITNLINIVDGWTLRFIDTPVEGSGQITGGDRSVVFRGGNIVVPIAGDCLFDSCRIYAGVTANPILSGCYIIGPNGGIVFDNVDYLVVTGCYVDAHSSATFFKFAYGSNGMTFTGNSVYTTLPATIFASHDGYKRVATLGIAGNLQFNPFKFELTTDVSGQVTASYPNGIATSKPALAINVEGDYYAYILSWTTVYARFKDPVIQLKDNAGNPAGAGVTVRVQAIF